MCAHRSLRELYCTKNVLNLYLADYLYRYQMFLMYSVLPVANKKHTPRKDSVQVCAVDTPEWHHSLNWTVQIDLLSVSCQRLTNVQTLDDSS